MAESFAPMVVVPGRGTYTPPGWMWVFAFATAGCEWAIKKCETEEWKNAARLWFAERKAYYVKNRMDHYLQRLEEDQVAYNKAMVEVQRLKKELQID